MRVQIPLTCIYNHVVLPSIAYKHINSLKEQINDPITYSEVINDSGIDKTEPILLRKFQREKKLIIFVKENDPMTFS